MYSTRNAHKIFHPTSSHVQDYVHTFCFLVYPDCIQIDFRKSRQKKQNKKKNTVKCFFFLQKQIQKMCMWSHRLWLFGERTNNHAFVEKVESSAYEVTDACIVTLAANLNMRIINV